MTYLNDVMKSKEDAAENLNLLEESIKKLRKEYDVLSQRLYELSERELKVKEIYRLAGIHLPRLQRRTELSDKDKAEIEKWLCRAKSLSGLDDIILAFREMDKYKAGDIKINLYALIQKIIIGGPFKEGTGKK